MRLNENYIKIIVLITVSFFVCCQTKEKSDKKNSVANTSDTTFIAHEIQAHNTGPGSVFDFLQGAWVLYSKKNGLGHKEKAEYSHLVINGKQVQFRGSSKIDSTDSISHYNTSYRTVIEFFLLKSRTIVLIYNKINKILEAVLYKGDGGVEKYRKIDP